MRVPPKTLCGLIIAGWLLLAVRVSAGVPHKISYQGQLSSGLGQPLGDTTVTMTFTIYESGGTSVWTSGPQSVTVHDGLFTYVLGSSCELPLSAIDPDQPCYLGIKVGGDAELSPRTELISAAYAYRAATADTASYALAASVASALPAGAIVMWSGTLAAIPAGWALCDGSNGTPNLLNLFVRGVGVGQNPGTSGGTLSHTHSVDPTQFECGMTDQKAFMQQGPDLAITPWYHTHAVDVPATTSTDADHLPPFYRLAYIMKL